MKIKKLLFLALMAVFLCPNFALASAWWGTGAKPHKWILNHGGTLINFDIVNYSGSKKEYKAVMYDEKGKVIEAEWGVEGIFDDAKDGIYTIKAKRGEAVDYRIKDEKEEGKTFATIKVTAHPGERMKIKFDYKKKSAKMETDYVVAVEKSKTKPIVAVDAQQPVVENIPEELTPFPSMPDKEKTPLYINESNTFFESAEEFVHPDALAKETERVIIKPAAELSSAEPEKNNIWKNFIQIISAWLRMIIQ